jgi:polar amino acid transport system substrate-binding protein
MKKVGKVLSMVLAAGCVMGMAAGCNKEEEKVLKIGFTYYAPMNYIDETTKEFVGFDTEFATKVCEELGYKAEFVEINWNKKVIDLQAGTIDCIWNGMTITDELKAEILISDAYMENKQVVVVRTADADKYTTVADLANAKSIAYENGGAAAGLIEGNTALDSVTKNPFTKQADTLLEVKTSASDVAVIDYTMAKTMTGAGTDYADLTFIEVDFPVEEYGIGFRKADTELCSKVNELIAKYETDGTFDAWLAKYFV